MRKFVIFGRGRSGTTLLVSLLRSHPDICCEYELLHNPIPDPLKHIKVHENKSDGCSAFGFKLLSYQLKDVQTTISPESIFKFLLKEDYSFVYVRRTNLVRHAISNITMRARGKCHVKRWDSFLPRRKIDVDPHDLMRWIKSSEGLYHYEQELLGGIDRLSITYEADLEDPKKHQVTADRIYNWLGIPRAPVSTPYVKVTPVDLRDLIKNYDEIAKVLSDTPYTLG